LLLAKISAALFSTSSFAFAALALYSSMSVYVRLPLVAGSYEMFVGIVILFLAITSCRASILITS